MIPKTKSKHKNQLLHQVLQALKKHQILTYSDLAKIGASGTSLKKLSDEGLVIPVGNGIYASTSLDPFVAAVLATAKYYPQAVISGATALQIHGLGEEFIEKIDVDIPRETSIRNRMLKVHRVPQKRIIGIVSMNFNGSKIKIYDLERTLCEAYLLDPEGQIFFKALKRYCAARKVNPDPLIQYDRVLKTRALSRLRQELADG